MDFLLLIISTILFASANSSMTNKNIGYESHIDSYQNSILNAYYHESNRIHSLKISGGEIDNGIDEKQNGPNDLIIGKVCIYSKFE